MSFKGEGTRRKISRAVKFIRRVAERGATLGNIAFPGLDAFLDEKGVTAMMRFLMVAEAGSVMSQKNVVHLTKNEEVLIDHTVNHTLHVSSTLLAALHVRHLTLLSNVSELWSAFQLIVGQIRHGESH